MLLFDRGPIEFPGLGISINPPDGFTLPGTEFKIALYGIIIMCGVLLAVLYAMRRAPQFGIKSDDIVDVVLVGLPSAIVGARLYYVILEWDNFFGEGIPWTRIFDIRSGGLAIYGGVIAAVLSVGIFCLCSKKRRRKFLPAADVAGIGFLIGQCVGRWGNFFNREAFGSYCDNLFAMRLSESRIYGLAEGAELELLRQKAVEGGYEGFVQVHPTFLYESVWNLVGFVLLHFLSKKRKFDGQVFLYYLAWYGLGRFFIEGLRTDSLMSGSLRFSQIVAIVTFVAAVGILVYKLCIRKADPAKMLVHAVAAEGVQEEAVTVEAVQEATEEEMTEETVNAATEAAEAEKAETSEAVES